MDRRRQQALQLARTTDVLLILRDGVGRRRGEVHSLRGVSAESQSADRRLVDSGRGRAWRRWDLVWFTRVSLPGDKGHPRTCRRSRFWIHRNDPKDRNRVVAGYVWRIPSALIVELRGLYPEIEFTLKDQLIDFLSAENELVRAKRAYCRSSMQFSGSIESVNDLFHGDLLQRALL